MHKLSLPMIVFSMLSLSANSAFAINLGKGVKSVAKVVVDSEVKTVTTVVEVAKDPQGAVNDVRDTANDAVETKDNVVQGTTNGVETAKETQVAEKDAAQQTDSKLKVIAADLTKIQELLKSTSADPESKTYQAN